MQLQQCFHFFVSNAAFRKIIENLFFKFSSLLRFIKKEKKFLNSFLFNMIV